MTIIEGCDIVATPCCGAHYATHRYLTMNFSARGYWTDGWRERSLMPNDEGLRRCHCGQFFLTRDLIDIGTEESSDLPHLGPVPPELLPECLAHPPDEAVEAAARVRYWRYLNHPYRDRYREHRDAEEARTRAAWEAANPERTQQPQRLRRRTAPVYVRPEGSPFTCPPFVATEEQLRNMRRLSEILEAWHASTGSRYTVDLAELYREQGRFEEAELMIATLPKDQVGVTSSLIAELIVKKETAPMRYRM